MGLELRNEIQARDKLHSLACSFPKNHSIWNTYRELRNSCKSLLRSKMNAFFLDKTTKFFKDSKKFWSFNKMVVKTKKSSETQLFTKITEQESGTTFSTTTEMANAFNKHFTNLKGDSVISNKDAELFINDHFMKLKREGHVKIDNLFKFDNFTIEKVQDAIAKLDSTSSCGISQIPVSILKNSSKFLSPILCSLFNTCLKQSKIPDEFKIAIAFPLFKKGDRTLCDNYRCISVLSPIAKVFERLLSNDITTFFSRNKLFCINQHGFRANFSCETAIQTILDNWKSLLDENKFILAIFIDFKKAFDLIDPFLLFLKLFHYGFDFSSLCLIRNYFENRFQKTRISKSYSNLDAILLGVPQGSILGPLLFLIFINDLSLISKLFSVLFADDTTLSDSHTSLDQLISNFKIEFAKVFEWCTYNRLYINWSKTKIMFISKPNKMMPLTITLNGQQVEVVSEFKLLGCTIDSKLTFLNHVKILTKVVNTKLFAIKNIFFLSFNIKLQFFKTFILPHFDFCFSLFIYMSSTLINKINKVYNSCIKHLLKIDLHNLDLNEQYSLLKPHFLLPFKFRLFYRISLFCYKILNNQILNVIFSSLILNPNIHNTRESSRHIFCVPFSRSSKCSKRLSIFLPKLVNGVLRYSSNLNLTDFKNYIITNIFTLFEKFATIL
jgi:hypothetical protein